MFRPCFPPTVWSPGVPFPPQGPREASSPGLNSTMRRSDILTPFPPRLRCPSLDGTRPCACVRASMIRRRSSGLELLGLAAPRQYCERETAGLPKFLRNPCVPMPCSSTPARPTHQAVVRCVGTAPALEPRRRLSAMMKISGLNRTASALAVYASPARFTRLEDADSLPAAGQLYGAGLLPAGSLRKVSRCILHAILLPQTSWRKVPLL